MHAPKKKGSRSLVVVGMLCMTVGAWACYLYVPRFRTELSSSEAADVWQFDDLMESGPGANRHVRIEGIRYDTSLLAEAKVCGEEPCAFVPLHSADLFNENIQLLAQLPRYQGRVDADENALNAESEVSGVLRRLNELGVSDQFFLMSRMPNVQPFETWVIVKDARPMPHTQVWQMMLGLLAIAAVGNVLVASQPASAVGWLYIFNPVGLAFATLVGYPFRNPGRFFRGIGLIAVSLGIGCLALAYAAAFPDGLAHLPGPIVIMGAIPVAVLGVSLAMGGMIRFLFPPLGTTTKEVHPLAKRRPTISADILCGN
ncbi:metal-sensitive transcriptional regulator [Roseimaritima ulvae]|nr:hypothetical protein [Roseimaritima ulvae]